LAHINSNEHYILHSPLVVHRDARDSLPEKYAIVGDV
jgi:hypothetical protein